MASVELALDTASLPPARRFPLVRRLFRHRLFVTGLVLFAAMLFLALAADWLAPYAPQRMQVRARFRPPGGNFLMGTDNFGRDIFSRLCFGARLSLGIGFAVVLVTGVIGTAVGLAAGFFRKLDEWLMRVMDALMAFPAVMLALAIAAALGPSAANAVIALSVVYIPRTARIVRASTLVVREMDYVQAARAFGGRDGWIILRHVAPNIMAPLIVQLTFIFAYAVLAESILSFLGVGPPPPTPTWGNMIAEGKDYIREAWWIAMFPGLAICITVLGLNLLGDGLRDVLDPRLKVQQG
jgi:peptide/nickel transport system permease protein